MKKLKVFPLFFSQAGFNYLISTGFLIGSNIAELNSVNESLIYSEKS